MSRSTANKKLDEKNLKTLRELAALSHNKQCFDCHQRGPTYVNMTIGSFVCTSCSGRLRGLNPPHRVKSISMATFTHDEIEFVKTRGNEYCRKVWMGRHDKSRTMDEMSFKDETQMKDFLTLKYEKKRWYVSPSEIPPAELSAQHTGGSAGSAGSGGGGAQHNSHAADGATTAKHQPPPAPASVQSPVSHPKQNLVNLIDDPFGVVPPPAAPSSNGSGGFANFANFDAFPSAAPSQPPFPQAASQLRPIDPSSAMPKSATVPAMSAKPPAAVGPSPGDKYSALKELDELFSQPATQQTAPVPAANPPPSWMPPAGGYHQQQPANQQSSATGGKTSAMTCSVSAFNVGGGGSSFGAAPLPAGNPFFAAAAQPQPQPAYNAVIPPQQHPPGGNPFFGQPNPFGGPSAAPFGGFGAPPQTFVAQQQAWPAAANTPVSNPFAAGQPQQAGWNPFFK